MDLLLLRTIGYSPVLIASQQLAEIEAKHGNGSTLVTAISLRVPSNSRTTPIRKQSSTLSFSLLAVGQVGGFLFAQSLKVMLTLYR